MNVFLVLVLVCVVLLGALIAWLGDVIGYRLGKSRRSLFGLRPRTTARLVGVIVGALLPLLGLGVAAVGSQQVRIALLHLNELRTRSQQLAKANQKLIADQQGLEAKLKQLAEQAAKSKKVADEAEANAAHSRKAAAEANRGLASARSSLRAARSRLGQLQHQRDSLMGQVDQLRAHADQLKNSLAKTEAAKSAVEAEREKVLSSLEQTKTDLQKARAQRDQAAGDADKLRAELNKLADQRDDLAGQLKRLQSEKDAAQLKLAETQEQLGARQNDLVEADRKVAAAVSQIADLKMQFEQALADQRAVEETPVVVNAGDEIYRTVVSGRQTEAQLDAALNEALVWANKVAASRGVAPDPDEGGRSVLLVRPLPPLAQLDQLPSEKDIIDAVGKRMLQADQDSFIVIISSLERHFAAEARALRVEMWFRADTVRFHKGEVLTTLSFGPRTPAGEVLQRLLEARPRLRDIARRNDLLPDPKTGEYGVLVGSQVLNALRTISRSRHPVDVDLVAAKDIRTADPLAVTLEVRPARVKPSS